MRRTVLSRVLLVLALVGVVGSVGLGQQTTIRLTSAIYSNATQPWWEDVIATYEAENP
ncbi:MAG: hypothetical protein HY335_10470, partial [Deinococcus sp.]|nr:hypothetical protein [Deinococcus sp.]